jgi:putative ABC transport system ATP-binding protein
MIILNNVTKTYNNGNVQTEALKGINLKIKQGEYIAIMGTSGSGKSTLLNILGGMDTLTGGEYFYDDIPVHELNGNALHAFRKQNVSFVFQQFALMNHYTVYENVEVPLLAKGINKRKRKEIIMETLDLVGIGELSNKLPIHLSGGQQQRCAIARAIASDNNMILADEPTGALDKKTGIDIMNILKDINRKGKTVIVITHDTNIAAMADRIVYIEDGSNID